MNSVQALVRNMRTCRPDAKGETVAVLLHGKSTDVGHRGGLFRSSDETSVMEVERRGKPVWFCKDGQPGAGRNRPYETNLIKGWTGRAV
jgi:hypothetical protein